MIVNFKYRVVRKLERQGYRVHPIWNDNNRCPFDLISVNPNGKVAGVKLKDNAGKNLKDMLSNEVVIGFKEETDKKAGIKFKLEVVLKR